MGLTGKMFTEISILLKNNYLNKSQMKIVRGVKLVLIVLYLTIITSFLFFSKSFPVSPGQKLDISQIFTTINPTYLLILVTSVAVLFEDFQSYLCSDQLPSSVKSEFLTPLVESYIYLTPLVFALEDQDLDNKYRDSEDDFVPRLVHMKYADEIRKHEDHDHDQDQDQDQDHNNHDSNGEEIVDYSCYDHRYHEYDADDEYNDDDNEDDDFKWRIEEFIGMMKRGWREEMLEERRLLYMLSESSSTRGSQITMADFYFSSTSHSHSPKIYHYAHEQVADKWQIVSLYG